MAFFGLTCLAEGNSMETIFRQHQARQLGVHDIPDERWDELFHNFSLTNVDTVVSSRGRLKVSERCMRSIPLDNSKTLDSSTLVYSDIVDPSQTDNMVAGVILNTSIPHAFWLWTRITRPI
jgi:hypothetical protein